VKAAGKWTVRDRTGAEGTDTLVQVEKVSFNGSVVTLR
jgi:hypothetical protein